MQHHDTVGSSLAPTQNTPTLPKANKPETVPRRTIALGQSAIKQRKKTIVNTRAIALIAATNHLATVRGGKS